MEEETWPACSADATDAVESSLLVECLPLCLEPPLDAFGLVRPPPRPPAPPLDVLGAPPLGVLGAPPLGVLGDRP